MSAIAVTPRSFTLGLSRRTSSTSPRTATSPVPIRIPRYGPSGRMKTAAGTRIPSTIATPPMRGSGRLWTRGRSVFEGSSTAPIRGASQAVSRGEREDDPNRRQEPPDDGPLAHQGVEGIDKGHPADYRKGYGPPTVPPGSERLPSIAMTEVLAATQTFDERIRTRTARVGIVGLGYAGLPARDGVRGGRLRRDGRRPERRARPGGDRAALVPRGRPGGALRGPRGRAPRDGRLRGGRRARRADDLRPDPALEDAHARHLLRRLRRRVRGREPAPGTADRPPVDHVPGHDGRDRPPHPRADGRHRRPGLLRRLRARARRPREQAVHDQDDAEARRRGDRGVPAAHGAPLPPDRGRGRARVEPDRGRDGEAPREHLPRGQHRPRERARAHVRQARDLALGGDRGRGDEAVRVPPPLPRPGPRRRLHSRRAPVPRGPRARVRLLAAADRRGARDQHADALLRRPEGDGRARTRARSRRRARACCSSGWPTRPTSTTRASRRASR